MPFVRQMEKQFERGKKGQLISKKFAKSKVVVKITVGVVVDQRGSLRQGTLKVILKGGARGGGDEPG